MIVARPGQNVRITLFDVQPPASNQQRQRLGVFATNASATGASGGANGPGFNSGAGGGTNAPDNRCVLYATIKDAEYHPELDHLRLESSASEHVVCSGGGGGGALPVIGGGIGARQTAVYTMPTHSVTVTVYHTPSARFILKYEGTCIGVYFY